MNTQQSCTHIEINIPEKVATVSKPSASALTGELCLLGVAELP